MRILLGITILLPILAGALQCCFAKGWVQRLVTLLSLLSVMVLSIVIALCTYHGKPPQIIWPMHPNFHLMLMPDFLGCLFAIVIALTWLLVSLFSLDYLAEKPKRAKLFHLFYLATLCPLLGLSYAGNLPAGYVFFELIALCSIPMIALSGTKEARSASLLYLGYSVFGAALGLFGMVLLSTYGGLETFVPGGHGALLLLVEDHPRLLLIFFLMVLGFASKAGMLPLQAWLPVAHPVALTPGSAVLSGIITKSAVLILIRLSYYVFPQELLRGSWAQTALITLSLLSIFSGSMLAYREQLLKRRLAFSTVSQVSYLLLGIFLFSQAGLTAAIVLFVFHGFSKVMLFLCLGELMHREGISYSHEMEGVASSSPLLMVCFGLTSLSMVGIPPLGGFWGKWLLCLGVLQLDGPVATGSMVVLMLSALLTAGYLFPLVISASFSKKARDHPRQMDATPPARYIPLICFTALTLLGGLMPQHLMDIVQAICSQLF